MLMEEKELKDIKVGDVIFLHTTYQVGIAGFVLGKGSYADGEGHIYGYLRMRINEENYQDIYESEITEIWLCSLEENSEKYWTEFETKYSVSCLDEEGSLKEISTIVNEVLITGVWDKMTDDEKAVFVRRLNIDNKTELDLLNALNLSRKRNNELHEKVCELADKQIDALQKTIDFKKSYNDKLSIIPAHQRWAFDLLYKMFGVDEFIRDIY